MTEMDKPLFIFEMANNHQGSIEHGLRIIRDMHEISRDFDFRFAFKLQYRSLDSFIHPDYKNSSEFKYVKRFSETRLNEEEFKTLRDEMRHLGFTAICTPFDEESVDMIERHNYDIIKIGSCSFTDWPLLERIAKTDKPVIGSAAGVELGDIDQCVTFFINRGKKFSLLHCVAEYPTIPEHQELNQIDLLRNRYKNITIGYSTHESPDNTDSIKMAIAKGAMVFEKHVGVRTESVSLNAYSADPQQVRNWLLSAKRAYEICGVSNKRYEFLEKEKSDLASLQRGMFAMRLLRKGEQIDHSNTFYAIPVISGQLRANDSSKYNKYTAKRNINPKEAVLKDDVEYRNIRPIIQVQVTRIIDLIKKSNLVIPVNSKCELSHHYGIEKFEKYGAAIISCINREYCKKIIVILPGQDHPSHFHKIKEETFNVVYGDLVLKLADEEKTYYRGDMVVVERGKPHSFTSKTDGAVFEELSTTHYANDSYYEDKEIIENKDRKTEVYLTKDIL